MRFAILNTSSVVQNVVEADTSFGLAQGWIQSNTAQIGDAYVGGVFTTPGPSLAQAQTTQLSLMDSSYNSANQTPIAYNGTTFQADNGSTVLMSQTIQMMTSNNVASVTWWDINNVGQTLTLAQLVGLGAAIFARGQTLFAHKQTQKAAIRAATTVAQVQAIVW